MLARVAESLYWIGRNLERTDHCSRFLKVQYFSTLDTPMMQNKDFALRSIMFMAGTSYQIQGELQEKDVWRNVIFDINNPSTIFSIIKNARENARSIRNSLSMEIWESINKWYLQCSHYDENQFSSGRLFTFSEEMKSNISVVKSNISNTILHNDIYHFILLGVYLERALQVLRITRNKISDWVILSDNGVNQPLVSYQWTILLKSIECFDIYNSLYPGRKSKESIFKLIFQNNLFPRSITYALTRFNHSIAKISFQSEEVEALKSTANQLISNMMKGVDYKDEDVVVQYINNLYDDISKIHQDVYEMYFK